MSHAVKALAVIGAVVALVDGGAAALNFYTDPYGVFGNLAPDLKPANQRMYHAHALRSERPSFVLFGSSRAEIFEKPVLAIEPKGSVVSLNGTSMYELRRFFEHATHVAKVDRAVLLLDFEGFNATKQSTTIEEVLAIAPDGSHATPVLQGRLPALLSLDALTTSVEYLTNKRKQPHGRRRRLEAYDFTTCRFVYPGGSFLPPPLYRFSLEDGEGRLATLEELERFLDVAQRKGVELKLFISPAHSWLMRALESLGLWPTFEAWKGHVVRANEEIAKRHGRAPFAIWDFSGYNAVTTEPAPRADGTRVPNYYYEPSHFTAPVADTMLRRAYGLPIEATPSIGRLLTSATLDDVLAQIRQEQAVWNRENQEDVLHVESMKTKTCAAE